MTAGVRSRLDREVRELLREHPELIAVAELIASLRPEAISETARAGPRRRLRLLTDRPSGRDGVSGPKGRLQWLSGTHHTRGAGTRD